jgi:crotonobetainyl-CoA:carnitine CoA-transferase CaiB-like acyl-CoA transferase
VKITPMTANRSGPLAHVRVLDLSRMYPGAFATSLLADLGADVWKIEAPGFGDGMRFLAGGGFEAAHVALNRGKRSMTLDLRKDGAADVLRRLVRGADVLVESHKPGALDKQGVGYSQLSAENPGLVWCSLSGFGQDGPYAQAPGHDITYLGAAGVLTRLAAAGVPPTPPQMTVALPIGALMGTTGVLAALAQRERTGHGAFVDASLAGSAMWALAEDIARAAVGPAPSWPPMSGRAIYQCGDGKWVTVAATEPKSWAALCEALDVPDLADHRFGHDEPAAIERLRSVFATKPAAAWVQNPGLAGGVGPCHDPGDLHADPQVVARRAIEQIDGTGERVLGNPLRITGADGTSSSALSPAPALGEHTDVLLAEAGFERSEITALRGDGLIV